MVLRIIMTCLIFLIFILPTCYRARRFHVETEEDQWLKCWIDGFHAGISVEWPQDRQKLLSQLQRSDKLTSLIGLNALDDEMPWCALDLNIWQKDRYGICYI